MERLDDLLGLGLLGADAAAAAVDVRQETQADDQGQHDCKKTTPVTQFWRTNVVLSWHALDA